jgi:hypothetical protein
MTTVVATRDALYADSQASFGDSFFESKKLYRIKDSILGISGTSTASRKFLKWFETRDNCLEFNEDDSFTTLELSPNGLFMWDHNLTPIEILSQHMAIGSGHMAALAALHLGSSPEVAIETACKLDPHSGGPLQVLHLTPPNGNPINNSESPDSPSGTRSRKPKK